MRAPYKRFWAGAVVALLAGTASAETVIQTSPQGGPTTITTTLQNPGTQGTTTEITTITPTSKKAKLSDGRTIEMDSDGMVYLIYPDGARAYAPDGINTLSDGSTITVKDGKRMP